MAWHRKQVLCARFCCMGAPHWEQMPESHHTWHGNRTVHTEDFWPIGILGYLRYDEIDNQTIFHPSRLFRLTEFNNFNFHTVQLVRKKYRGSTSPYHVSTATSFPYSSSSATPATLRPRQRGFSSSAFVIRFVPRMAIEVLI